MAADDSGTLASSRRCNNNPDFARKPERNFGQVPDDENSLKSENARNLAASGVS